MNVETVPQVVRIYPSGPLRGSILPPSSKYHTLRYILAAFLASGESRIYYPAISDDTKVLLQACTQLGAKIQTEYQADGRYILTIQGTGGLLQTPPHTTLDVGNAGAVLRLLLGICAISPGAITFTTPYPESLGRRPNDDLLQALTQLGATVDSQSAEGTLPITIHRGHLRGGPVRISGKKSSQYISALLFLGPLLQEGLEIEIIDELSSASFIDLTIQILTEAGISVLTKKRYQHYVVPGMQRYQPKEYIIPGDYPSAAALLAATAIAKGEITLHNLPPDDAGGQAILEAFSRMGMSLTRVENSVTAQSHDTLRAITLDGNQTIDSIPVIAAAACFANSPSHIYNIANLHLKESDRINDLATELNKAGCHVIPSADAIDIHPMKNVVAGLAPAIDPAAPAIDPAAPAIDGGANVDAHADHRLVQALAVIGLGSRHPVTIFNAQHIAKSYPHFFDDLATLGARIERIT